MRRSPRKLVATGVPAMVLSALVGKKAFKNVSASFECLNVFCSFLVYRSGGGSIQSNHSLRKRRSRCINSRFGILDVV